MSALNTNSCTNNSRRKTAPAYSRCSSCGETFAYRNASHAEVCPACRSMQSFEQAYSRVGAALLMTA